MKVNVTSGSSLLSSLATVLVVGTMAHPAMAQDSAFDGEFSVQRFNPAPGPRNFVTTRGARQDGDMTWSAGFMANYGYKPFVVRSCFSETDCDAENALNPDDVLVVENLVTADFMGSLTVIPELQVGMRIPVTWVKGQGLTDLGEPDPDELSAVGLGDMELEAKYRFVGSATDPVAVGGGVFVTAPFGTLTAEDSYVGDNLPTFGARAIADLSFDEATVGANLVGVWRETGRVGTTEIGSEFRYNVGFGYQVSPLIQVLVDGFGATKFSGQAGTNSLEAMLGGRVTPTTVPIATAIFHPRGIVDLKLLAAINAGKQAGANEARPSPNIAQRALWPKRLGSSINSTGLKLPTRAGVVIMSAPYAPATISDEMTTPATVITQTNMVLRNGRQKLTRSRAAG